MCATLEPPWQRNTGQRNRGQGNGRQRSPTGTTGTVVSELPLSCRDWWTTKSGVLRALSRARKRSVMSQAATSPATGSKVSPSTTAVPWKPSSRRVYPDRSVFDVLCLARIATRFSSPFSGAISSRIVSRSATQPPASSVESGARVSAAATNSAPVAHERNRNPLPFSIQFARRRVSVKRLDLRDALRRPPEFSRPDPAA